MMTQDRCYGKGILQNANLIFINYVPINQLFSFILSTHLFTHTHTHTCLSFVDIKPKKGFEVEKQFQFQIGSEYTVPCEVNYCKYCEIQPTFSWTTSNRQNLDSIKISNVSLLGALRKEGEIETLSCTGTVNAGSK